MLKKDAPQFLYRLYNQNVFSQNTYTINRNITLRDKVYLENDTGNIFFIYTFLVICLTQYFSSGVRWNPIVLQEVARGSPRNSDK